MRQEPGNTGAASYEPARSTAERRTDAGLLTGPAGGRPAGQAPAPSTCGPTGPRTVIRLP